MSRSAAPLGEVITPMRRGKRGSARLRSLRKQPLGGQARLQALELALQRADAGLLEVLDDAAGTRRAAS